MPSDITVPEPKIVKAPWTDEQVTSLNEFQAFPLFHEFTCGTENCRATLRATKDGWVCDACKSYTQDWAHQFMADGSWRPKPVPAASPSPPTPLPQEPGYYLWYITDWGYLKVGAVHVLKDSEKHLAYLRGRLEKEPANEQDFFLYQNDAGDWLTMYHDARDGKPPVADDGRPWVDGYRAFDFWWLVGGKPPQTQIEMEGDEEDGEVGL